jgi:3-hydroxy acid dehydrogenase/malonic semialdehyde reductase
MYQPRHLVITGASSGIGLACAEHLAAQGHALLLGARRTDRLQAFCDQHPTCRFGYLDVTNPESIQEFTKAHASWLSSADGLINSAGLALGAEPLQTSSQEDVITMVDTNVKGLFSMTHAMLPFLLGHGKGGDIVNIGSIAGVFPYRTGAVYGATKAAVQSFSHALRMDLGGTGIRVSVIEPGKVETEFSLVRFHGDASQAKKAYEGYRPLRAEDIAATVAFVLAQPAHVAIQQVLLTATDQVSSTQVVPVR